MRRALGNDLVAETFDGLDTFAGSVVTHQLATQEMDVLLDIASIGAIAIRPYKTRHSPSAATGCQACGGE
jgi:hypothetical protein